jgi:ERCC4-type nuclease
VKSTQQDPIHIIVDDRETRCGILEILNAMESVSVTVSRLTCGDYKVEDNLIFERKTLPDLAISIKDGRIFRQGCRLAQSSKRGIIILEGTSRDLTSNGMRREALQGALISLTVFLGIPLLRSRNLQETADLILYTARQNRAVASGALPRHGIRPRGKRKTQLHILQGIPGLGPERAYTLLDKFGSVEAVLTASMEELVSIKGIGARTVNAIRWAVHEPDLEYDRSGEDSDLIL